MIPRYVLYTAVLPAYRTECLGILRQRLGSDFLAVAGAAHLDPTVRTGIPEDLYVRARNIRLLKGRLLLQLGYWIVAFRTENAILDLNPRSITAWIILLGRRLLRRRTLLWGHLFPRRGRGSGTSVLRRIMRSLAQGTVVYGYDSVVPATEECPGQAVWVAPNALYRSSDIQPGPSHAEPKRILYVGRLEPSKRVDLLWRAFQLSDLAGRGAVLTFVGRGSAQRDLELSVNEARLEGSVEFCGAVYDVQTLRAIYAGSAVSVSPGYVGLSLTQSLGFGVPIIVADRELHSPEIELERFGGVEYFESGSAVSLAASLRSAFLRPRIDVSIARRVKHLYSAEAMANGLCLAFLNSPQDLGASGWPE